MLDVLELLLKRRSIRRYIQKPVNASDLQKVLQAGLAAPSSRGRNPWEFVVVQDSERLHALGRCRHPQQAFLPDTPAAIVVLGKPDMTDVWIEDCAIVMTVMQLEAEMLGLGSCWVQIRNRMAQGEQESSSSCVKTVLRIPESYEVLAILALGLPAEEKAGRTVDGLSYEKIHVETF